MASKNMNWPQAMAVARQGHPVRNLDWLATDGTSRKLSCDANGLWLTILHTGGVHVPTSDEMTASDYLSTRWVTDDPDVIIPDLPPIPGVSFGGGGGGGSGGGGGDIPPSPDLTVTVDNTETGCVTYSPYVGTSSQKTESFDFAVTLAPDGPLSEPWIVTVSYPTLTGGTAAETRTYSGIVYSGGLPLNFRIPVVSIYGHAGGTVSWLSSAGYRVTVSRAGRESVIDDGTLPLLPECGGGTTVCPIGQHLSGGVCVEDTPSCDPGYHWDEGSGACVEDSPTCASGYHWDEGEGTCVPD